MRKTIRNLLVVAFAFSCIIGGGCSNSTDSNKEEKNSNFFISFLPSVLKSEFSWCRVNVRDVGFDTNYLPELWEGVESVDATHDILEIIPVQGRSGKEGLNKNNTLGSFTVGFILKVKKKNPG